LFIHVKKKTKKQTNRAHVKVRKWQIAHFQIQENNFFSLIFVTNCEMILSYCVGNSLSVSQSFTLNRIDKVKHYIRIKTHNTIILRF